MATSSKLIEHISPLSSKGIQNPRSNNLCGFKSVKFRAASNFSGFKIENFIGKSTSATIKNNNVVAAASFDSEAQQPTSITLFIDLIRSFEAVTIKTLKWVIPATVMVSSLSLAMMMIYGRKPAPDFQDKHSLSLSESSSFAESETQPEPVKLDLVPVYIVVLWGVVASVVCSVKFNDSFSVSIYKIQVGLLFDQTVQRDLRLIRKALYQCDSSGWGTVLEDTIESLDWHRSNWVSGNSSVNVLYRFEGNKYVEEISYENQKRFEKERPYNLRKMEGESSTSYLRQIDKFEDKYMVLTLVVGLYGKHKLPTIRKKGDLDRALKKLKLYNSKNLLMTINVYQAPGKGSGIMSRQEIQKCYPDLRHFNK
ncbi:hypothetical protein Dsin_027575 [Dipteronia sinensis]|uniref:Uncharacterized protein n=1 Tax=Dipteronia sinensis TaxID=43782 RepID=A0AAD9ZP57_9ROSI|nr:hypothetical protein Dsin_027575 [Dipteronia sinensis]